MLYVSITIFVLYFTGNIVHTDTSRRIGVYTHIRLIGHHNQYGLPTRNVTMDADEADELEEIALGSRDQLSAGLAERQNDVLDLLDELY